MKWLLSGLVALLILFVTLTTWKMLEFRDRLHGLISNPRWEQTLSDRGAYDDGAIVFFGDSQLALWRMAPAFGSLPIRNRGISGDYASRAVRRFERDALDPHPSLIVILIGSNDLTGGATPEDIAGHIDHMMTAAIHRGIDIVLCSLLPVRGVYAQNRPPASIVQINHHLQDLCARHQAVYVDFHTALSGHDGLILEAFTLDGLHPSDRGYAVMTRILYPILMSHLVGQTPMPR